MIAFSAVLLLISYLLIFLLKTSSKVPVRAQGDNYTKNKNLQTITVWCTFTIMQNNLTEQNTSFLMFATVKYCSQSFEGGHCNKCKSTILLVWITRRFKSLNYWSIAICFLATDSIFLKVCLRYMSTYMRTIKETNLKIFQKSPHLHIMRDMHIDV